NSTYPELDAVNDFYIGMVVAGNNSSVDQQSYLEVVFTPESQGAGNAYNVTLAVLALFDTGYCGTSGLPSLGLSLTWNNLPACETDLLDNGRGQQIMGLIPGGSYLQVTFNGANPNGITVYVNDSAQSKYSSSLTLSPSPATNQSTFKPFYASSCADICYLNWTMPFGEGFGVDLGVTGLNTSIQTGTDPIWVGSPEYFNQSGYAGDFSTLSLESASGGCSGSTGPIPCPPVTNNWGYPYFQFNGSRLLYGSSSDYTWTTRDFGGVLGEFSTQGQPSDFDPLALDQVSNSSQVGYIASGSTLTVSARVQDLGSVESVNLTYTLPGDTPTTVTMTRSTGNRSIGVYQGVIPGIGSDGTIVYSIQAVSAAGTSERMPVNPHLVYSVVRGPIPLFTLTFATNPAGCGAIDFDGTNYATFQSVTLPANTYTAQAIPCYPYVFSSWSASGINIGLLQRTANPISVNLTANGTLTANWRYIRPFDQIGLAIDTNHCGSITLNGTTYIANTTIRILEGLRYSLSYSQCALNVFSGWVPSDPVNLTILGGAPNTYFTPHGNGTVELTYLPIASNPISVIFDVKPSACGGVLFRGAGYVNGTAVSLASGVQYPVAADPCAGWGLDHFNATAGLTLSGNYLSALSPGVFTATYYEETIVTIETYPAGCGYLTINDVAYYNGSQIIVTNGSTFLIAPDPCAGYYFSGWYTSGGVFVSGDSMTVYGSGVLEAVFQHGKRTDFVAFITAPSRCGTIAYNNVNYSGSQYIEVSPNSIAALKAYACAGYGFVSWAVGGPGITIVNNTAYVNGSGSITANFHPLVAVTLLTNPSDCGSITIAGASYSSGSTIELPAPDTFSITAAACPHYHLASWLYTSGASVSAANRTVSLSSTAILTAIFQPSVYNVLIDITPFNCGSVVLVSGTAHNDYTNNTTVSTPFGSYVIEAKPCSGFHLSVWVATGGAVLASNSSNSTSLTVGGSGTVTAVYVPVSPTLRVAVPSSAYAGTTVTLTANVSTPVPPYTYTYQWNFGDGTNSTTHDGFTTHTYGLVGTYLVRVTVIDPYHRTSTVNATIAILSQSSNSLTGIGLSGYIAIGIAGIAVAAALLLGRRRPGEATTAETPTGAPSPPPKPTSTPPSTPLP
ncbi:MAG TPA: PKD domain-containing protein, partial [Thermoplasmata archaeon]|nr:PKD domain-containing protein [Thermoplasmata archaeon]